MAGGCRYRIINTGLMIYEPSAMMRVCADTVFLYKNFTGRYGVHRKASAVDLPSTSTGLITASQMRVVTNNRTLSSGATRFGCARVSSLNYIMTTHV